MLACNYGNNDSGNGAPQEVSISHLKSLCKGDQHRIVGNYIIRGVVVATDWLGECYKSAIVVDKTGGLEFAIESHNISEHLPIFSEITIFCQGLTLARIGGKIELGAPPTGTFPLDNIDDDMFERYIRIEGLCEDFTPATKRFSEISQGDISALIRFENIRVSEAEQGLSWCDTDENDLPLTTYRTLIDREGNTFAVRTLASCHYAKDRIPENEITIIGVIDYSDNRYFLRVANNWILP
jgi:hypothetical protein